MAIFVHAALFANVSSSSLTKEVAGTGEVGVADVDSLDDVEAARYAVDGDRLDSPS
jgi:hypothetical protein